MLTYDTARLTYVSGQAADKGASVAEKSGSIRVIGYGADESASTKVITLTFKTKAAGTAKVVISSAKIDTGTNAPKKRASGCDQQKYHKVYHPAGVHRDAGGWSDL